MTDEELLLDHLMIEEDEINREARAELKILKEEFGDLGDGVVMAF